MPTSLGLEGKTKRPARAGPQNRKVGGENLADDAEVPRRSANQDARSAEGERKRRLDLVMARCPITGTFGAQVRDETDRACGMRDSCKSTRASGISSRQRSILGGCRAAILCGINGIDDLIDHHGRVLCKNRRHVSIAEYDSRSSHITKTRPRSRTHRADSKSLNILFKEFARRAIVGIAADWRRATRLRRIESVYLRCSAGRCRAHIAFKCIADKASRERSVTDHRARNRGIARSCALTGN